MKKLHFILFLVFVLTSCSQIFEVEQIQYYDTMRPKKYTPYNPYEQGYTKKKDKKNENIKNNTKAKRQENKPEVNKKVDELNNTKNMQIRLEEIDI